MTKFSHLTNKTSAATPRRGGRSLKKVIFNLSVLNGAVLALILCLGVGYLVLINGLATKGYQIKELEDTVAQLQEQNSDLELQTLTLQSMGSVKDKVAKLNMVAVGEVEYLSDTPVASAR